MGGRISVTDKFVKRKIGDRLGADSIPLRIEGARKRLNLSQTQLAEELGIKPNTVSEWESGRYRPSAMALVALGRLDYDNAAWWYEQAGPKFAEKLKLQQVIRNVREAQKGFASQNTQVDQDLLAFALERVDAALRKRRARLPSEKYAQAVALFYDLCRETQSRNPAMLEAVLRRIA
jgi:transcriptional regulator with XRE-family HTH domain